MNVSEWLFTLAPASATDRQQADAGKEHVISCPSAAPPLYLLLYHMAPISSNTSPRIRASLTLIPPVRSVPHLLFCYWFRMWNKNISFRESGIKRTMARSCDPKSRTRPGKNTSHSLPLLYYFTIFFAFSVPGSCRERVTSLWNMLNCRWVAPLHQEFHD